MKQELVFDRHEQLTWLDSQSPEDISSWLKKCLLTGDAHPLIFLGREDYRSNAVLDLYADIEDPFLKDKLRMAVAELVNRWGVGENPDYFVELTVIAGRLRATGAADRLLYLAKSQALCNQVGMGKELHHHALQVLFGLKAEHPDLVTICQRDITDPRYTPICYRKLWEINFEHGITNLRILLEAGLERPSMDIQRSVIRFIKAVGLGYLTEKLRRLHNLLGDGLYGTLLEICQNAGIRFPIRFQHGRCRMVVYNLLDPSEKPQTVWAKAMWDLVDSNFLERHRQRLTNWVEEEEAMRRGLAVFNGADWY